ncbi:MAG: hypothetical protein JSV16_10655, partial [Candidatus Hydrogenedentota bacterium]
MKAMFEMGYLAANVGEQDLLLGLDYMKYVADFAGVPLLSANIVGTGGETIFQQFLVRQINVAGRPVRVAVIGVISTEFGAEIEETNPGLIVEEYGPKLEQLIGQLRGRSDLLILLAHVSDDEALALAARFPQIDLIIASHSGDEPFPAPLPASGVPIVFAGSNGMHVGVARFRVEEERARLGAYSVEKLDGRFDDSPHMLALLDDYRQMVKAEKLLEAFPRTEYGEAKFTGNESCRRCHSLSSFRFRKEKHAVAFEGIEEKGHEYDPECVRCHTVGFGYVSGFGTPDT